jgi:PAS domain S-box-containing protein
VEGAWHASFKGAMLDHEYRIVVGNTIRWVRQMARMVFDAAGVALSAAGIAQDVAERKSAEAALLESEIRYRTAFQISPDAINITRLVDGLYLDVNSGFTRLMGWTKEESVGRTSSEINISRNIKDRQALVDFIQRYGFCQNLETDFVAKDGKVVTAFE